MIYNFIRIIIYILISPILLFSRKLYSFVITRMFLSYNFKKGEYIWVHLASVGEINLSEPLIKKILNETNYKILISLMTNTGMETAIKKYEKEEKIDIIYFPLDDYFKIKTILKKINLKLLILIETEIWPNLVNLSSKKAKIILANGRISDKSYKSYLKLKFILKKILAKIDFFIMQTDIDSERIISLGAEESKTVSYGNLKFDIKLENYTNEELEEIKKKFKIKNKKIFVAGSTREGEEEKILKVFKNLKDYTLFLVPRHIERVNEIENNFLKNKFSYGKWSENFENEKDIILVDKIGVLRKLYALCDIAFVGGTLVNIGGHSILEPLYYGKTPIYGPYTQNIRDIAKEAEKLKIAYKVESEDEIYEVLEKISKNRIDSIEKFFKENSKVVERTFKIIIDII